MTYTDWAVHGTGLAKAYDGRPVLAGIDLAVARGGVFALLGPNGAGKTTTVRILGTLTRADRGSLRVAGFDAVTERRQVRRRISLTGQYVAVDDAQTGRENLVTTARLAGLDRRAAARRAAGLLERFDLTADADRRVGGYSGGMRRRLDLAAGLVGTPEVIFLDEPTTGLDPRSRQQTWDLVRELAAGGTTVVLTTQYLEEADRLADRVAVLDGGRIVAEGSAADLKRQVGAGRLDLTAADADALAVLRDRLGDRAGHCDPERLTVAARTDATATRVRRLLDELDPDHRLVAAFAVHEPTLDDAFFALTAHAAHHRESSDV